MTQLTLTGGQRITVQQVAANPHFIPAKIMELLSGQFIDDVLFRYEGNASVVAYEQATPTFLDGEVADLVEFEEIPVFGTQKGAPRIAVGIRKGAGVRVSEDMKRENRVGEVNRQITALVNTLIRARFVATRQALLAAPIPTIAAAAAWDTAQGVPRSDLARAAEVVGSAGESLGQDTTYGYEANTVVLPGALTPALMNNDNFLKVYGGNLADQNIAYTGKLPQEIMGMAGLRARFWPKDRVLVAVRKEVGFFTEPRPLEVTPLYPEGNGPNGGPRESHRSDATMKRTNGVDQPYAACWITGVSTP